MCVSVPHFCPLFCVIFIKRACFLYIEHVVHGPLPDDWTGFSTEFAESLKGILFHSPFLPFVSPLVCPFVSYTFST